MRPNEIPHERSFVWPTHLYYVCVFSCSVVSDLIQVSSIAGGFKQIKQIPVFTLPSKEDSIFLRVSNNCRAFPVAQW